MDKGRVVGASPAALRTLHGFFAVSALRLHDTTKLIHSKVLCDPPLPTRRGWDLNEDLASNALRHMNIIATALGVMAKYLQDRATYQELVSRGHTAAMPAPQYLRLIPDEPDRLLNLGVAGLQVVGGIAGWVATAPLIFNPEPLLTKTAAAGLATYSGFMVDAGLRTIMSGGAEVKENYIDTGVEWAALRAGLAPENAAALKQGFGLGMGVGAPLGMALGTLRAGTVLTTMPAGTSLAAVVDDAGRVVVVGDDSLIAGSNLVSGRKILAEVRELYQSYKQQIEDSGKRVTIIRFEAAQADSAEWQARMEASLVSARTKVSNLQSLGFKTEELVLPPGVTGHDLANAIKAANLSSDNLATIVQMPAPPHLRRLIQELDPAKDIDGLRAGSPHTAATAEGIWRLAEPFTPDRPTIAVVGSEGFVGQGVVRLAEQHGLPTIRLDPRIGTVDLVAVRDADIVISVVGRPNLLEPQHLAPHHRLVIDGGFTPIGQGVYLGDVSVGARGIPQLVTSVPGGVGPVEMGLLMERAVKGVIGPEVPSWRFAGLPYQPRGGSQ